MRDSMKGWTALMVMIAVTATVSCSPTPQSKPDTRSEDAAAIRAADIAWSKAAGAGDAEAVVSFYTDDAVVLPPNMPAVIGKEAARKFNAALMAMPGYSAKWEPDQVEVARSGDIGFARGHYVLTATDPGGNKLTDKGKYVEIWKKQADGSWKVALESPSTDLPSTPMSQLRAEK